MEPDELTEEAARQIEEDERQQLERIEREGYEELEAQERMLEGAPPPLEGEEHQPQVAVELMIDPPAATVLPATPELIEAMDRVTRDYIASYYRGHRSPTRGMLTPEQARREYPETLGEPLMMPWHHEEYPLATYETVQRDPGAMLNWITAPVPEEAPMTMFTPRPLEGGLQRREWTVGEEGELIEVPALGPLMEGLATRRLREIRRRTEMAAAPRPQDQIRGLGEQPREETRMEGRRFEIGDRVVYEGPSHPDSAEIGWLGTVRTIDVHGAVRVSWDVSADSWWYGSEEDDEEHYRLENIRHAEPQREEDRMVVARGEIVVGSRVRGLTSGASGIVMRIEAGRNSHNDTIYYRVDGNGVENNTYRGDMELLDGFQPLDAAPREFREGDRVRYVGPMHMHAPEIGTLGTARSITNGGMSLTVGWDDRSSWSYGGRNTQAQWLLTALEHVDEPVMATIPNRTIRIGSRIRDTGVNYTGVVMSRRDGGDGWWYRIETTPAPGAFHGIGDEVHTSDGNLELLEEAAVTETTREIEVGRRMRSRTSGNTGTITRIDVGRIFYRVETSPRQGDRIGAELNTSRTNVEILDDAPATATPEFPFRVGMRINHRARTADNLTTWVGGTDGLWNAEVVEVDPAGQRIRIRHETSPVTSWWGRGHAQSLENAIPVEGTEIEGEEERRMISTASLGGELTAAEKRALGAWLVRVFGDPEGDNPFPRALRDKLVVYYQGAPCIVRDGQWMRSNPYLMVGNQGRVADGYMAIKDRLAVAFVLMNYAEADETLKGVAKGALTRYLLGEYQEMSRGIIVTSKKKTEGLAFSNEGGHIAAKLGDEWVLPTTGEPIQVTSEGWTTVTIG